jgi:hypothetical protein
MLCLANSIKYGERCLAGIRLDTGGWIRPVSDAEGSALVESQYTTAGDHIPSPLDTIEIKVKQQRPKYNQPENWVIADDDWRLITTELNKKQLLAINTAIQKQGDIIFNSDKFVSKHKLRESQIRRSLTLLSPDSPRFYSKRKRDRSKPYTKFEFDNTQYNFSITDHSWREAVREEGDTALPSTDDIEDDKEILYTVSLAQSNDEGACYKLVAGVFTIESEKVI